MERIPSPAQQESDGEIFSVPAPLACAWVTNNDRILDAILPTRYEVRGLPEKTLDGRFLIIDMTR